MSSRGFGGFPISPQKDQALLSTGASYTAHITFTIASAKSLIAAASDGLTSNCQCECWVELKSSRKATTVSKTKVAKSTRNPIWNHAVDFGQLDLNDVDGIKLNLKHISGFSTKSLGEAFVPVEFLYDIETNLDKDGGAWFNVEPTADTPRHGNLGTVRLLFNPRAASQAASSSTASEPAIQPRVSGPTNHSPLNELSAVKACHRATPKPGETWYVVAAPWIENWLVFVSNLKHTNEDAPGSIPNHFLIDGTTGRLRANLRIKRDFRLIDGASWALYHGWYGGGPVIRVVVPQDCTGISLWMQSLQLDQVGRVDS
ncbi:hypothetical protein Ae201684P_018725 [Aphanomyces euteiches]|uniref:Uncharacterized protein n=1 Tax=Aphanomyces euteiches TaxID=100861 RepID=A0A6G0XV08_9STRA|nr:hypothetical protein Ae201684_000805 [Aphanomyces euteiches]KAH9099712.1 hypothetical protein Ae201684P_018725 [Aphanomyces euteiches]KAH9135794.1 hypothetical protein AeRB84_018880 [Aphanomyces euteiches]